MLKLLEESGHTSHTEIAFGSVPHRNILVFDFFIPKDNHIGDFLQLGIADLGPDFFLPDIVENADLVSFQSGGQRCGGLVGSFRNRKDGHLDRGKPERKSAGKVFDQHAEKSFERTCNRAMQHDRTMRTTVRSDVFEFEALGQGEVHLRGAALPPAADSIPHLEIDFGSIKGATALIQLVAQSFAIQRTLQTAGRFLPDFVASYGFFRFCCEKRLNLLEAEEVPQMISKVEQPIDFAFELIETAEQMRIIHGKATYSHQAMQHAGTFKTIDGSK